MHYASICLGNPPPIDRFTPEDTYEPQAAKPKAKPSGGKKQSGPKPPGYWDTMYPVSDDFQALLNGVPKKEKSDEP